MGYWKYKIVHDYNATKLINEFREENLELKNSKGTEDDLLDFIIYAEKDDFTISLGKVLLIKMSENMVNYFHEYKGSVKLQNYWAKFIYEENKNNKTFQFNENEIADAFLESILLQSKIGEKSPIEINHFIKDLTDELSNFLHNDIKFSREQWDPTLKSDKYVFSTFSKNVLHISERTNLFIKKLKYYQKYISQIKGLEKINNLISSIINGLKKLKYIITKKGKLDIAFLCGVWNGIVEFIAGIIDLILLLINLLGNDINNLIALLNSQNIDHLYTNQNVTLNLEVLTLVEGIEEVLSVFIKNPEALIDGAIEEIKNYAKSRYTVPNLTDYQLAYHAGEDVILAIDIVFTVITIIKGIAKLAKKIPKFVKWVENLITKGGKGARKIKGRFKPLTRKPTPKDINELKKIRTLFNAGRTKNVAFTKGEIGGKKFHLKSRSGKPKGTPQNFDNFKTIDPENYHYKNGPCPDYINHTEQKQIEYLYNLFKNNKSVKGKIEIISDLKICPNCVNIINRFKKDFPNIEIETVWVREKLK